MHENEALARKIATLSAQLKRRMDRSEQTRNELCAALTEVGGLAAQNKMISAAAESEVIAPKDGN